jgi:hypothetical protein
MMAAPPAAAARTYAPSLRRAGATGKDDGRGTAHLSGDGAGRSTTICSQSVREEENAAVVQIVSGEATSIRPPILRPSQEVAGSTSPSLQRELHGPDDSHVTLVIGCWTLGEYQQ